MVVKNSNEGFEQAPGAGPGDDSVGPAAATFPELLTGLIPTYGDRVFLPRRRAQSTEPVTFARLCRDVDALAMALLDLGLSRGDRVGLIADNRYEWLLVDLALASLGVVDVPRGSDTTPGEVQFILQHSGSRMCFVEDERVAREVQDAAVPEVQRVVVMQEKSGVDGTDSLGGLLAAARRHGVTFSAQSVGGMFGIYFSEQCPDSFASVTAGNTDAFNRFFHAMLEAGHYFAPSAFEAGFVSVAHTASDIAETVAEADAVFAAMKA